jgi:hypothetical protein
MQSGMGRQEQDDFGEARSFSIASATTSSILRADYHIAHHQK